ncbi:MAG: glycosyltransferase [Spirochaetaceae bacterium]|nr:glycosyltransferase [Spirochaetaceae bacterium]
MKKIKVLMLVPSLNIVSGVTSYAMAYLNALNHQNVQMDFACYFDIYPNHYTLVESYGGKVFVLPPFKKMWEHIVACKKILEEGNYDIVHDNSLIITLPMMMCAKKYVNIRILHSHSTGLSENKIKAFRNFLFLPFLKLCSTNFAACTPVAAKTLFGNADFTFIPNVVTSERFSFSFERRNEVKKNMNIENKIIVASIGRITVNKNPFFAVDVMSRVIKRNQNVEYWWIGSGPKEKQLANYVEELGLTEYIKLLGKRSDIPDLLQAMDVLLFPSVFEGLGLVGIEAQIMGVPVIASESIPEEINFTDLVTFVDLKSGVEAWCEVIEKTISQKRERRSYRNELYESMFSDRNAGTRLEEYYRDLIEKK